MSSYGAHLHLQVAEEFAAPTVAMAYQYTNIPYYLKFFPFLIFIHHIVKC